MDYKKLFGSNVRTFRKRKGLKQEELAKLCGLSRTYISEVELGKKNISLENMVVLAVGLGVNVVDLFVEAQDVN